MTQRDTFKDSEYWISFIQEKRKNIEGYRNSINSKRINAYNETALLYAIFRDYLEIWIGSYSAGESFEYLNNLFPKVINSLEEYIHASDVEKINIHFLTDYIQSLWLISISILLDADDSVIEKLKGLVDQSNLDTLFDQLFRSRIKNLPISGQLLHPKPYLPLYTAITKNTAEQAMWIQQFIDRYYIDIGEVYWKGTDTKPWGFFGYWLFELAAFVKVLGIDDHSFAGNIHYPVDLVRR